MINFLKKTIENRFIKFVFIGGVNTVFGYGLFSILITFKIHYSIALFISTVMGVLFNFKTIGSFVFKNRQNHLIFKFFSVYTIIYFFNVGGVAFFEKIGVKNMYLAGAIMVFPSALISFFLNKYFVFYKKKE